MPHTNAFEQCQLQNKRLFWIVIASVAVSLYSMSGWREAGKVVTGHFPPDLRNGATIRMSQTPDVPAHVVYAFGHLIWQKINRWESNGSRDYGVQIFSMQDYLTPSCREQLIADMNIRSKAGELLSRTRTLEEILGMTFSEQRVIVQGNGAWKVVLDAQIRESVNGMAVKSAYLRYPLRIVRFDVDREKNPWGLAVDCYGNERPARLDPKAVAVAQGSNTIVSDNALQPAHIATDVPSVSELAAEGATAAASAATPPKPGSSAAAGTSGLYTPTVLPAPAN